MVRMRMPLGSSFARIREMCTSIALADMCSSHDATAPAILSLATIASMLEKRYSRIACSRCERSSGAPFTSARFFARSMVSGPCSIRRGRTARVEDQHRLLAAAGAELLQPREPVDARQSDVEDHQVDLAHAQSRIGRDGVVHRVDHVALTPQGLGEAVGEKGVVLDDQDAHGPHHTGAFALRFMQA